MDGIDLPDQLEWILEEMGIQWPDTKELAMIDKSLAYGKFLGKAYQADSQAVSAVDAMLRGNTSSGLAAFKGHFDNVAGSTGYMFRAGAVDGATGVALAGTGAMVLEYKLFVLEILVALAEEAVAAAALAVETAGASVAAFFELVAEEAAVVYAAEAELIGGLQGVGRPVSHVAGLALDVAIKHLQAREVHKSPDGVSDYPTGQDRANAEAQYQKRWDQLKYDSDKGKVTPASEREATVALGLEKAGKFPPGSVGPAPVGRGDFIVTYPDGRVEHWDQKAIPSYDPANVPPPQKDCYTDKKAQDTVNDQLSRTPPRQVVFDTAKMNPQDRAALIALIRRNPQWAGKVIVY